MIPFLRKQEIWCRSDNPSDKGLWAKRYVDVIFFPGVKITRCGLSKQERKKPLKLTIRD